MRIIKSLDELSRVDALGITIGNFDGVHLGHRHMLEKIKSDAEKLDLSLVVITFRPHPIQILRPRENFLLNSYDERRTLLSEIKIPYLIEITFDRDVSTLSPDVFLSKYILRENTKKIYFGHDFAFGANKSGDANYTENFCKKEGIEFSLMGEHQVDGQRVSSSLIRDLLANGDVEHAAHYLGRDFYVTGRIIKGAGRGKKIGFPTANLGHDESRIIPLSGVYITKTYYGDSIYQSVTNIGHNPTFTDENNLGVETHLLDFDRDIYGESLRVDFIKRLRKEKKFPTVNNLIDQIKFDIEVARSYFQEKARSPI